MPPPNEPARRGRVLRILYAEDLRDLREVARIALTRDGHSIEYVADGALALERMNGLPFTVTFFTTKFSVGPSANVSSASFRSQFSSVRSRRPSPGLPRNVPIERNSPRTLRSVTSLTVRDGAGCPFKSKNCVHGATFSSRPPPPPPVSVIPSNVIRS